MWIVTHWMSKESIHLFCIEFIGATLVCKTIQVSSVQLNKISSAYCIMLSLPHAKSLSAPIFPPSAPTLPSPHPPFPLAITRLLSSSMCYVCVFWLTPSLYFIQSPNPLPSDSCQSVPCIHVSVLLFVSLLCSLDSTCKWYHMVFVFLWLAYFISIINLRSILLLQKVRFPSFLWPTSVPLCKCTTAFLPTHPLLGTWAVSRSWRL